MIGFQQAPRRFPPSLKVPSGAFRELLHSGLDGSRVGLGERGSNDARLEDVLARLGLATAAELRDDELVNGKTLGEWYADRAEVDTQISVKIEM